MTDLFLAFLQPKFDPSIEQDLAEQDVEEGAPGLPTASSPKANGHEDDEFRPFIRRLPEFQFWLSATKAILVGLTATLFPYVSAINSLTDLKLIGYIINSFFDIPVYAPILLIYFCVLFTITMRRQVRKNGACIWCMHRRLNLRDANHATRFSLA